MSNDNNTKDSMMKLTRDNYRTWMAKAKDYILALDHNDAADLWAYFEWRPNGDNNVDPISIMIFKWQTTQTQRN